MRGLLGLAGLAGILIVTFIVVYMWADYTQKSTPAMKQLTGQANQLAGRSSAGVPIGGQGTPVLADSKFAPVERNGKLVGLTVVIMPMTNGLYEYFGLIPGDTVLGIGPFKMGDENLSDFESARDWVQEGMQRQMEMRVDRGGTEITLPRDRAFVPTPGGAGTPSGPAGASGQQPQ